MDKDQNGTLSAGEFGAAMTQLGAKLSEEQVAAIVTELDTEGIGEVAYEGFVDRLLKVGTASSLSSRHSRESRLQAMHGVFSARALMHGGRCMCAGACSTWSRRRSWRG
jgi:hypothetical protein